MFNYVWFATCDEILLPSKHCAGVFHKWPKEHHMKYNANSSTAIAILYSVGVFWFYGMDICPCGRFVSVMAVSLLAGYST